jgi:hypothetical protein
VRGCQDPGPSIDLDLGPEIEVTSADLGGSLRPKAHWERVRGPPPRSNRGYPGTCSIMMGKGRPRGRFNLKFRPGRPEPAIRRHSARRPPLKLHI